MNPSLRGAAFLALAELSRPTQVHIVDSRKPSEHISSWTRFKYCLKYDWWKHLGRWRSTRAWGSSESKGTTVQKVRGGTGVGDKERSFLTWWRKSKFPTGDHSVLVFTITRNGKKRLGGGGVKKEREFLLNSQQRGILCWRNWREITTKTSSDARTIEPRGLG